MLASVVDLRHDVYLIAMFLGLRTLDVYGLGQLKQYAYILIV